MALYVLKAVDCPPRCSVVSALQNKDLFPCSFYPLLGSFLQKGPPGVTSASYCGVWPRPGTRCGQPPPKTLKMGGGWPQPSGGRVFPLKL